MEEKRNIWRRPRRDSVLVVAAIPPLKVLTTDNCSRRREGGEEK